MSHTTEILTIAEIVGNPASFEKFDRMAAQLIAMQANNCVQSFALSEAYALRRASRSFADVDWRAWEETQRDYREMLCDAVHEWNKAVRNGFICC